MLRWRHGCSPIVTQHELAFVPALDERKTLVVMSVESIGLMARWGYLEETCLLRVLNLSAIPGPNDSLTSKFRLRRLVEVKLDPRCGVRVNP